MSDWEHVDKEEIIISEEGLDEAVHHAYLKGKRDVLDKIRAEILVLDDANYDFEGYYKAVTDALKIIDKYKAESEETECR